MKNKYSKVLILVLVILGILGFYSQFGLSTVPSTLVSTESTARSIRPAIVVDTNDNIHIVWDDLTNYGGSGSDSDIFYKRWNNSTQTWGQPK